MNTQNLIRYLAAFFLVFGTASGPIQAATLAEARLSGAFCDAGHPTVTFDTNRHRFDIEFNNLSVQLMGGKEFDRQSCDLLIKLNLPKGTTFKIPALQLTRQLEMDANTAYSELVQTGFSTDALGSDYVPFIFTGPTMGYDSQSAFWPSNALAPCGHSSFVTRISLEASTHSMAGSDDTWGAVTSISSEPIQIVPCP